MILDDFRLDQQVAVVTGGSRGLGLSAAKALAQAGAHIVNVQRTDNSTQVEAAVAETGRELLTMSLDVAETDEAFREEIPAFVAEIRDIFERWQLAAYLDIARQTERFDPRNYDDPKEAEIERRRELGGSARDLLLVERAREWLMEE